MTLKSLQQVLAISGLLYLTGCATTGPTGTAVWVTGKPKKVVTGIELLKQQNFAVLEGKRVGLVTNATGVDWQLRSTVDLLFEAPNVNLVALYGPEHGVRGAQTAGEYVDFYIDERTKLPVYSLYGKTRKPTPAMLADIDVLVYDIQGIGCRSYTFISTLGVCMEACAENQRELVILDRPNPLGGNRIEGNLAEDGFFSFVSQYPVPYVYGLTVGEFARMLNGEMMLQNGVQCDLTVVPMQHWKRSMTYEDTGLEWVPTSPHVPHKYSPLYYVSSGVLGELGVISEGVGYTAPFQLIGAEWVDGDRLAVELNALNLPGVIFRPVIFKPYYGRDQGNYLGGVQVHIIDPARVNLLALQFHYLEALIKLYPDHNPFKLAQEGRLRMFDKVTGSDKVRELFSKNFRFSDVEDYLNKDVKTFTGRAKKYYLYN
ncbi:MAG: DUF1343 domain-containing protein [Candidatus Neomarinimicrobiota bacterium]